MYVFLALFPIVLALILMTGFKFSPGKALPLALIVTAATGLFFWHMDGLHLIAAIVLGVLKSLDIIIIVYSAVLLLNILKRTGAAQVINSTFVSISPDRRIQTVIIAWIFSSFIEGAAGFGSAPALVAPLLAGLGFPVFTACAVALIGNTLPVPFGAVGTPFLTLNSVLAPELAQVGYNPETFSKNLMSVFTDISLYAGCFLPFLMVCVLICLSGRKNKISSAIEIFPFCLLAGVVYFLPWKLTAVYLGPELPSMAGAVCALPVIVAAVKSGWRFFVPSEIWDFEDSVPAEIRQYRTGDLFKAWSSYMLIAFFLVLSRLPMLPVKEWLTAWKISTPFIFDIPGTSFQWALLYNPGVFPFLPVAFFALFCYRVPQNEYPAIFLASGKQVLMAAIAIASSFAIVQIMIFSNTPDFPGMLNVIAVSGAAVLGKAYIAAAPIVGVFGTFFAGSCTVSNILFGTIQFNTAHIANLPEDIIVALQNVGGGIGSMIRISGVVATCATVHAAGKEGKLILLNLIPAGVMVILALIAALLLC